MFRLALAAVLSLGLACQGDECDASSLLALSQDKDVPKKLPKGCTDGIKCENESCRCAKPGEIERIREDIMKKAGKSATPATSQGAPKAGEDGCMGKSILCKTAKSEANCNYWKRVGCSWGQALLQKDTDFPTGCTHGVQCNEDGCRCAKPGEVKQVTEEIEKEVAPAQPLAPLADEEAPADDACMGEWFLCKSLETEESCKVFQSEGCVWGKAALVQKDMPKGCKNGITCRNGDCRCAKLGEIEGATPPEGEACTGSSHICAKLTSEKLCGKLPGCSWTKETQGSDH